VVATLKDVAAMAGVSTKTVSNVINGNTFVTEEKRQRVQAAIAELHYQPNLSARFLRKSHVGVIALAIPDMRNPYFADIEHFVASTAHNRSYTVLLEHTNGDRDREIVILQRLRPHLIDGVILSPLSLELHDLQSCNIEIPLVLLGERSYEATYDHIGIDNVAAARVAVDHLIHIGKRRIAAIGALLHLNSESSRLRQQGYMDSLLAAGLSLDPQLVVPADRYLRHEGMYAMKRLLSLEQPPDAVFCFNDLLAIGAMRALYEAGLRIPEDVAVVGFDNIEEGHYAHPSLTAISPDKQKIGEIAASHLLDRIEGTRTSPPEHIEVPFQLIVRESTAGRNAPML
jgi:DNA-binding LacI/PurR family transcriptional regulator